jgi:3-phenylpropionate/cinnamic acid dioxygenase small subunit
MATVLERKGQSIAPDLKARAKFRELRLEIEEFHFEYCANLERGDIEHWPDYFTDDANYVVIARDNHESNLPLGLVYCEGKGMLRDRAYALRYTEMYAPRYLQLRVSNTRVMSVDGPLIKAEASYLLLETLTDELGRVQQIGKYYDVFERVGDTLLIKDRRCVYDTVIVNNCIVFPV